MSLSEGQGVAAIRATGDAGLNRYLQAFGNLAAGGSVEGEVECLALTDGDATGCSIRAAGPVAIPQDELEAFNGRRTIVRQTDNDVADLVRVNRTAVVIFPHFHNFGFNVGAAASGKRHQWQKRSQHEEPIEAAASYYGTCFPRLESTMSMSFVGFTQ